MNGYINWPSHTIEYYPVIKKKKYQAYESHEKYVDTLNGHLLLLLSH